MNGFASMLNYSCTLDISLLEQILLTRRVFSSNSLGYTSDRKLANMRNIQEDLEGKEVYCKGNNKNSHLFT